MKRAAMKRAAMQRGRSLSYVPCPHATVIQTLIFSKGVFDPWEAIAWLAEHHFSMDLEETSQSYRARQHDPSRFVPGSFRTIRLGRGQSDVRAVIGCPKSASLSKRRARSQSRRK